VANLFRTLLLKFYKNRLSFVDDMAKHSGLLFLGHGVEHSVRHCIDVYTMRNSQLLCGESAKLRKGVSAYRENVSRPTPNRVTKEWNTSYKIQDRSLRYVEFKKQAATEFI